MERHDSIDFFKPYDFSTTSISSKFARDVRRTGYVFGKKSFLTTHFICAKLK